MRTTFQRARRKLTPRMYKGVQVRSPTNVPEAAMSMQHAKATMSRHNIGSAFTSARSFFFDYNPSLARFIVDADAVKHLGNVRRLRRDTQPDPSWIGYPPKSFFK